MCFLQQEYKCGYYMVEHFHFCRGYRLLEQKVPSKMDRKRFTHNMDKHGHLKEACQMFISGVA